MTELTIQHLSKHFGEVAAVRHIDLAVKPGSLVALLGPSGCGKTTTLRMIAGLESPTTGDILFNGESVLRIPTERRNIGLVFQRYVLFPHMNVETNVGFGLRMRGLSKPDIAKQVGKVLDTVQLGGFEKRFPGQLSGGQQQRVAIARTVITNPKIMLMDEPLANLDAKLRDEMRVFITGLQKQLGVTTLLVTHDQVEAVEIADAVGVMFDGRLEQFGAPEAIFSRPRTVRVAEFMGATNFIRGTLRAKDGRGCVLESPLKTLRVAHVPQQDVGASVTATIRPEHISIIEGNAENNITAKVLEVVYQGGMVSYKVRSDDIVLRVKDLSTRRFALGEEVKLSLPQQHLWIFPEASEANMVSPQIQ